MCDMVCNICDMVCNICDMVCNICDMVCNMCDMVCNMCDMVCNMCDMFLLKREVFHKNGFLLDPYLKQILFLHEFPIVRRLPEYFIHCCKNYLHTRYAIYVQVTCVTFYVTCVKCFYFKNNVP